MPVSDPSPGSQGKTACGTCAVKRWKENAEMSQVPPFETLRAAVTESELSSGIPLAIRQRPRDPAVPAVHRPGARRASSDGRRVRSLRNKLDSFVAVDRYSETLS